MKTLFKIMVYPIIILLWAVIKLGSAITYISGLALGIVSGIFALTGLVFLITGSTVNGVIGLVLAYLFSPYSKKYLAEHEADILIHKAAKKAFDELKLNKIPSIKSLNSEYATLLSDKKAAYGEYVKLQKEVREMLLHKQNYEYILGIETDKNEKGERYHSREK